jgi:nucleotide-binding universal stress UspA family protein
MKILLAVDESSFSERAVKEVAQRPWPEGSEVKIISVVEPPLMAMTETWSLSDNYYNELEKVAEDQARIAVDHASDQLRQAQGEKLKITAQIIRGYPTRAITREADAWGADLIMVGSHGYKGLTRLLFGSVSQVVASHANCSVEIVHSNQGQPQVLQ